MAATYATNEEIRASYSGIDEVLIHTRASGAQAGSASIIIVDSAIGFAFSGTLQYVDTDNVLRELVYTQKKDDPINNQSTFYLSAAATLSLADNTVVSTGNYSLDHYRNLAKAWVDTSLTNPNLPANFKKKLEIDYVFYLACVSSPYTDTREWATGIKERIEGDFIGIKAQYPGVIRQTICKLVENSLTTDEIEALKYGPLGDQ